MTVITSLPASTTSTESVKVINTMRSAQEACRVLTSGSDGYIALDIKGSDLGIEPGEIMLISIANNKGNIYIFDVYSNPYMFTDGPLKELLSSNRIIKIVYSSTTPGSMMFWRSGKKLNNIFDLQLCTEIFRGSSFHCPLSTLSYIREEHEKRLFERNEISTNLAESDLFTLIMQRCRINAHTIIDVMLLNKSIRQKAPVYVLTTDDLLPVHNVGLYKQSQNNITYNDLFDIYKVDTKKRSALTAYRIKQLKEYWRERPLTAEMISIAVEDIRPVCDVFEIMTKYLDHEAVLFLIACSNLIANTTASKTMKTEPIVLDKNVIVKLSTRANGERAISVSTR